MTGQLRQAAMAHACESFEARIRRFPRHYRRRLRKLASGSKPMTDLLHSFPAAAFTLAAGKCTPEICGEAVKLVKAGAPLASIAARLGLPLWTRRLPPEAFARPLGALPSDDAFSRQIANYLPATAQGSRLWLQSIAFGHEACGSALALWLAGRRVSGDESGDYPPLLPLAAYVWFSDRDQELGHRLIHARWHAKMPFASAVLEARIWLERVVVDYCLEPQIADGGWFKEQKSAGYRFLPLMNPEDLREEGDKMENCVATYARKAGAGACLLYSVRRGGKRLATMEIVPRPGTPHIATIAQLLGRGNIAVPEDISRAAAGWLAKRGRYPAIKASRIADLPVRINRWKAVWQSYCAAKPQFSACLMNPGQAIARLDTDLRELAKWKEA